MSAGTEIRGTLPFTLEAGWRCQRAAGAGPAPLVVLLHGQGMRGEQMLRLAAPPAGSARHWLAPDGPYPVEQRRPERIVIGHAWYMYDGDQDRFRSELERGEAHLLRLLDAIGREAAVDGSRVTLAGYSQGGYLAGFVALRHPDRCAGLVLLNARLKHEFLAPELARGRLPRCLVLHSEADPWVSFASAAPGIAALRAGGAEVAVELHDGGHRLAADTGARIERWLDASGL